MADENLFYRLRSLDRLLGDKWQENDGKSGELAKQEIYFASPSELNDPMEGFSNIVFKGDKIVWHNFFKHYFICLERMFVVYSFCGEKENFLNLDYIPLYADLNNFPSPMYKQMFDEMYKDFNLQCKECIDRIAARTAVITKNELYIYLKFIHSMALLYIHHYHIKNGFKQDDGKNHFAGLEKLKIKLIKIVANVERIFLENGENGDEMITTLCLLNKNMGESLFLQDKFMNIPKNKKAVISDFPNLYLYLLEKLMYPEYYAACFLKEAHNSSVWGHYADGHKGVCLIFKSDNNFLRLLGKGLFDEQKEYKHIKFREIDYSGTFKRVNFFENIGRLRPTELSSWYISENGRKSIIWHKIFSNVDKWRESYWQKAEKRLLTKTKDWKYEKESRLIFSADNLLQDELDKQDRAFKYDFKDLDGIIFGINTPEDAKHKVIGIIKEKCQKNDRDTFNFYQAYYCDKNKNIQYVPLPKFVLGFKAQSNNQNATNKAD